jgi:uncharacterized protein
MNAPNSLLQDERATERKGYEPSMEEILASIRKIIADDQAIGSPQPAAPKEATPRAAFGAVPPGVTVKAWDLRTETQRGEAAAKSTVAATVEAAAPDVDHVKDNPEADRDIAPPPPPREQRPKIETSQPDRGAAVRQEQLNSQTAGRDRAPDRWRAAPAPATQAAVTEGPLVSPATDAAVSAAFDTLVASRFLQSSELISDMVREMLRPMLKAWLDDNLPILVERLVRAEIERVARGGR